MFSNNHNNKYILEKDRKDYEELSYVYNPSLTRRLLSMRK